VLSVLCLHRSASQSDEVLVQQAHDRFTRLGIPECSTVAHRGVSRMCRYTVAAMIASTEAVSPGHRAHGTALGGRCCKCRRPHPSGRRSTRQNDGCRRRRRRGRSAERHVGRERWRPPRWMKRECSQRGIHTEPWPSSSAIPLIARFLSIQVPHVSPDRRSRGQMHLQWSARSLWEQGLSRFGQLRYLDRLAYQLVS